MIPIIINKEPIEFAFNYKPQNIFFETIKTQNFKLYNINYHQKRLENTYKTLFNKKLKINLSNLIKPKKELTRVKVIYNIDGVEDIQYYNYRPKVVKKIMLIEAKSFNYNCKYLNRDYFNRLYEEFKDIDEFILTKNGKLTDTTIANIALIDSNTNKWHTPINPLLSGTTRERYLQENKLILKEIDYKNLKNYSKIALLNAMIDFKIL